MCTLDGGRGANGARMHNAFFGPAKKATYLFEPKLDLLTSEFFFDFALEKYDFSRKRQPTLSFCRIITPKRQHTLPF